MEERTTKRVDPSFLDGKEPLAVGYKIFEYDGGANGGYRYCDETNVMEGSVHTVTGELQKCGWGLHFCKDPLACLRYQEPLTWNRFALVEAYDEIIDHEGDDKTVARTLRIVKELSFADFIEKIKGSGVRDSSGVSASYGVRDSSGVRDSYGVRDSSGVSDSSGVYGLLYCKGMRGADSCIFCCGLRGAYLCVFNKAVGEDRYVEILRGVRAFYWKPDATNAEALRDQWGEGMWSKTPAHKIAGVSDGRMYEDMPQGLVDYVRSLPEFDEKIFAEIVGLDEAGFARSWR